MCCIYKTDEETQDNKDRDFLYLEFSENSYLECSSQLFQFVHKSLLCDAFSSPTVVSFLIQFER